MCFYCGRFECNRPGAICALVLSHLCESLLYCVLGESDGSRMCPQTPSACADQCFSVCPVGRIFAWHQRWHKLFFPGHNNAQSMCNSTRRSHCLADLLNHHIFHLLNYVSIWVILSSILLYNTHTSASLGQSSHLRSMNFPKVITSGSFLLFIQYHCLSCLLYTTFFKWCFFCSVPFWVQLWLIYSKSNSGNFCTLATS